MLSALVSRLVIIVFGLLFPSYHSFKAIRTKNIKEYTKWMIYWIVFSIFTTVELVTDIFISWFPFYYEVKVLFVVWLLSPMTKGAHILYTRVIHPQFMKHEKEIDDYLEKVSEKSYSSLVELGTRGLDRLVTGLATGALKAQIIMEQIQDVKEAQNLEGWDETSKEKKTKSLKKRQRKSSIGVTPTKELSEAPEEPPTSSKDHPPDSDQVKVEEQKENVSKS